ncbi:MAG: hypothetical protein LKJ90_05895 [Faecalibacterium sp.]|jgi:hypothetical protein|nr:hypothetical protein [Faecalibacterium sp.]
MLFDRHYDKAGPGVSEGEPRKKGALRFFEVLFRDFGSYWKAGILALLCLLPGVTGVVIGLSGGGLLFALLSGLVGGILAAPCMVGLFDTIVRSLRDEPGYWWHTYKMAVKRSAKASLLPGALSGLFVTASILILYILLNTSAASLPGWLLAAAYLLLTAGALPYLWMQVALLDLKPLQLLKNTFSLWFAYFPRTMLAAAFEIAYWLLIFLFFPYTELVLLLTSLWLPALLAAFAVYIPVEKAFNIEKTVRALHEKQRAEADTASVEPPQK